MEEHFSVDKISNKIVDKLNTQYPWRSLYRGLLPKFIRHPIEQHLNFKKQQRISEAWDILLTDYFSGNLAEFQLTPKKSFQDQKIIWQYWGQRCNFEQLPETVQICFNSVDKYKGDYQVIRLNDENLSEYLDLPNFVAEKRKNPEFRYVFFSDLLRFALLNTYGGIWIDATILLTDAIPEHLKKEPFFMFQRDPLSPNKALWGKFNGYFCWNNKHKINCLSSFIIGSPNHPVIKTALTMLLYFWKTQNHIPHYFFLQIMLDNLLKAYLTSYKGIIIDDTIPHLLHKMIKKKFDADEYQKIINQTTIHKLTYTKKYKEDSFFSHLKRQFI